MRKEIIGSRQVVKQLLDEIRVTDKDGKVFAYDDGIEKAINMILQKSEAGSKLMFIGNGASASISSHIATDFWRNVGIRAIAFNDASGLTCIANDFGYQHVFEKPIEMFANPGDILIAISSSGKSKNILCAVETARGKGIKIITLSGFDSNNPLSQLGDINFYVPSPKYGQVEVMHHFICHSFIDVIIAHKAKNGRKRGS